MTKTEKELVLALERVAMLEDALERITVLLGGKGARIEAALDIAVELVPLPTQKRLARAQHGRLIREEVTEVYGPDADDDI